MTGIVWITSNFDKGQSEIHLYFCNETMMFCIFQTDGIDDPFDFKNPQTIMSRGILRLFL